MLASFLDNLHRFFLYGKKAFFFEKGAFWSKLANSSLVNLSPEYLVEEKSASSILITKHVMNVKIC